SSLQALIDRFGEAEGVSYVFVTDPTGDIVVHTFVPAVPAELQRIAREDKSARGQKVRELAGVMDVSSPILGGRAGVVHVGMNREAIIRAAMNRGAFDFVTKPIDFQDLETTINKTQQATEATTSAQRVRQQLLTIELELNVAAGIQLSIL